MSQDDLVIEYLLKHYSEQELAPILDHPITRDVRIALGLEDLEFFSRYYLPHHFTLDFAPMHHTVFSDLMGLANSAQRRYLVEVIFRGAGKSTIVSAAFPIWCICYEKFTNAAMCSDSQDQAREKLATVKAEIENNDLILQDFGRMKGERWTDTEILTSRRIKAPAKLACFGAGMNIRGALYMAHRLDLCILDDVEKATEVRSETLRRNLWKWIVGDVLPAMSQNGKIIAIGNLLHYDGAMNRMLENPLFEGRIWHAIEKENGKFCYATNQELWQTWERIILNQTDPQAKSKARAFYEQHEAEMLEGTKVAWPAMFPYYELMLLKLVEGSASFSTERLNEPVDPSQRYFKRYMQYRTMLNYEKQDTQQNLPPAVWLVPWDELGNRPSGWPECRLKECTLFAATDPSMGQTATSHPSCITIVAKSPNNQLFVIVSDKQIRTPEQIMVDQNRLWTEYPTIQRWAIEPNQFQAFFAGMSGRSALEATGKGLPLVDDQTSLTKKEMRIESLQPDVHNGYIMFNPDKTPDLIYEIENYPFAAQDDALDSLEMAVRQAREVVEEVAGTTTLVTTYQMGSMDEWVKGDDSPYQDETPIVVDSPFLFV